MACYDLNVERLRLIANEFNAIFRVDIAAGEKYVLRVTLPEGGHDRGTVAAETAWLEALARETDLGVPRLLATRAGDLVVEAADAGVPEPRLCAIFGWAPGSDLADHLDAPHGNSTRRSGFGISPKILLTENSSDINQSSAI